MDWADALDAIEERLRRIERVIDGTDEFVPALDVAVDGPVPEHLVARAMTLIARGRALEERATRLRAYASA